MKIKNENVMRKVLFFIVVILVSIEANAQCLNSDGLKMVSKLKIGKRKVIEFKYNSDRELKEVVFYYTNIRGYISKEVITKEGNKITQKSYFNGRPYNRFKYEYVLNDEGKITKFTCYEYSDMHTIGRFYNDIVYENGRISSDTYFFTYKENTDKWCYDPGHTETRFIYKDGGWFYELYHHKLSKEQHIKYAPLFTEDEFIEARNDMEITHLNDSQHQYVYSEDRKNDTNIGLNYLKFINEFKTSQGITNILWHTEWIGLREEYLILSKGLNQYRIEYEYDDKGNIIKMNYYKGNGTEVNVSISIEYLIEKI